MTFSKYDADIGEIMESRDGGGLETVVTDDAIDRFQARGAVLFRGYGVDPEGFATFTSRFGANFLVHHNMQREVRSADGTTQTVSRGHGDIPLHRERAYIPFAPDLLFFYCVEPAREGGYTTLCDGVTVARALPAETRAFCSTHKLVFPQTATRAMWQRTLGKIDVPEAKDRLAMMGGMLRGGEACEYSFDDGDVLQTRYICPTLHPTKFQGEQAFANFLIHGTHARSDEAADHYFSGEGDRSGLVCLEDGTPFPRAHFDTILRVCDEHTYALDWQPGDVIMIDNSRWMHGRTAFEDDSRREILVRMSYASFERRR